MVRWLRHHQEMTTGFLVLLQLGPQGKRGKGLRERKNLWFWKSIFKCQRPTKKSNG